MANTILLPVDLNSADTAKSALTAALRNLDDGGAIHVLSVLPDFGMSQVSGYFREGFERDALSAFGEALTDWVNANVPEKIEVHPHVVHGTVYDEILRAAEKLSVDLIVMAAHRPEFADYLLGPNAARVVRHAKQSVYVVRN